MIAVDASALIAVAFHEDAAADFARKLIDAEACVMIAPTAMEAHISVRRLHADAGALDRIIAHVPIQIVPFETRHLNDAKRAFDLYGKGRGHPAQLNFGDCLVYGFAKAEGLKLLFKGNDFSQTDIEQA